MPDAKPIDPDTCDATCDPRRQGGPVREAGGTTGAGNLSPGGANRTGGATSGVDPDRSPTDPPQLTPAKDPKLMPKRQQ